MNRKCLLSRALLFLAILVLGACGADPNAPHRAAGLPLNPQVGGMVLPAVHPAQPAAASAASSVALEVGQTVAVVGDTPLRLMAGPSRAALVLEVYRVGATLTVIEPSGVVTTYPISAEGRAWYRLQAEDGLVGWAPLDVTHIEISLQGSDAD